MQYSDCFVLVLKTVIDWFSGSQGCDWLVCDGMAKIIDLVAGGGDGGRLGCVRQDGNQIPKNY